MKRLANGKLLCLALALLCNGCRRDQPPAISLICTLDGFGGGDCITAAGEKKYLAPSEMTNFWATTQTDMANFSAWCYQTSPPKAAARLEQISEEIRRE